METGFQRFLLAISVLLSGAVFAQTPSEEDVLLDKIIQPDIERREIKESDLDTENFELGLYYGIMNIEDFGSNDVTGVRFAYHVTEGIFTELNLGITEAEETSFERLSGGVRILTDDERELFYYNINVGYNLLPGEFFIGKNRAINLNFYVTAGAGNTHFADEEFFTYNFGAGLRMFPVDWLATHITTKVHIFDHEILGEEQTVNNLETSLGLTVFF